MSARLTQRELRVIGEAVAFRLADEVEGMEGIDPEEQLELLESAFEKISARIREVPR